MNHISNIEINNTSYGIRATGIPFGRCDSTSTSKVFTATVPGIRELVDGVCCMVENGVVTSESGFTLNVNGLGAKPVYNSMAAATRDTTIFNANYTMLFVYDETRVEGGCWVCYRGYDANTNTIGYQLRTNNTVRNVSDTARYYKIYFTSADGTKWVPASVNSTNNATAARPVNQRPIDPFGRIVYTSANTNYAAGANLAAASIWDQYNLTLGYSFNRTGAALTLTSEASVYLKCAPQTDGSAIMDADTPIVQALPTSNDGKIYIFLGVATSATAVELVPHHPVYYHDGTGIRIWTGSTGSDLTDYYTKTEMDTALNGKQGTIDDLATIRSGAALGATAIQQADIAAVATSGSYNDLTDKPIAYVTLVLTTDANNIGTFSLLDGTALTNAEALALLRDANVYVDIELGGSRIYSTLYSRYSDDNQWNFQYIRYDRALTIQVEYVTSNNTFLVTSEQHTILNDVNAEYFVPNTRKVNNKALSSDITLTASDVGAVPTTRTVNGKALSSNITLSASDVGADVFVVNIESDGNDGYTCDKTNAEIYAAWQAGRNIVLILSGEYLYKLNEKPTQTYCEFSGDDYDDPGSYRQYNIFTGNGQQKVTERYIYLQEYLQSGTNIKTINNQSLLGSGNLTASDIGALPSNTHIPADQVNSDWDASSGVAQILNKPTFKTINGESIVGTGDIEAGNGDVATAFTITITSTTIEVQPMTGAIMTVGTDVSFQVV